MTNLPPIDDPNYWRSRAEEARTMPEQMNDPDAKRTLLDIAAGYDRLALRAERRATLKVVRLRPSASSK